jgi:hypothetical protein
LPTRSKSENEIAASRRTLLANTDGLLRDRKDGIRSGGRNVTQEWVTYEAGEWSPDGQILSKGVTLSKEELVALKELLNKMEA